MAQVNLFNRDYKVSVDTLATSELRVQFHVTKTVEKEPNTCDLIITNLSAASRGQMKHKGMSVIVEAGYKDTRAIIFSGDSRICDHRPQGPDWNTKINCGDGETAYQYARFSKSWGAGVSVKTVITDVASGLAVNLGNLSAALNNTTLPIQTFGPGFAVHGNAFQTFDRLIKSVGLAWSIQQGALLVVKPNQPAVTEVVVLSALTGLLGSPEHNPPTKTNKQTTLTCKSLLNPKIRPGVILRLESANVKGDFIPQKVEHVGDSHGASWQTNVEAVASSAKVTPV